MENKEIMDQFLENRQNYMMDNNSMQQMNMNVASAVCDGEVGIQSEVVGVGGGGVVGEILTKYDEHHEEHDVGDDDEWKYVKEVQQSEKQQQMLRGFGIDGDVLYERNELAEKQFGNGDGGFVFGGDHHQVDGQNHHDLFNMGNGHDTNGHNNDDDNVNVNEGYGSAGFEENRSMDIGLEVDVKIETKSEHQEMVDEEEPSSLATNTTNGTSSLSDNIPPRANMVPQANEFCEFMNTLEDKENADPLTSESPNELNFEHPNFQLNPYAREFVPNLGSNPASPTSPLAAGMQEYEPNMFSNAVETKIYFGQAPSAVARHVLGDDDFVAQSPHKGKGDNNMDAVSVPKELSEFEQEADKRPHELETDDVDVFLQKDEVMTPDQAIQQLPLDDLSQDKETCITTDSTDFQPSNFMDHGPETSVDHEADFDIQSSAEVSALQSEDDVMKRSMYVANDDAIEDVLNSVQPIPTEIDSVNNSFIEESATESGIHELGDNKELLQVEEKEHVSHSPSTEEIQINLQNTYNSSNKDISHLPVDIDMEVDNMHEFIHKEQESQQHHEHEQEEGEQKEQEIIMHEDPQYNLHHETEQNFQVDLQHVQQPEPEQHFEEELHKDKHSEYECHLQEGQQQLADEQHSQNELNHETQIEEPRHELQFNQEPFATQEELNEFSQKKSEDIGAETLQTEESILADTTNPMIANDSFLDNSVGTHELQELHESYSPSKISEGVSATTASYSLNSNGVENQEETSSEVMSPTADEKHLFEETKEQQLFSISAVEQQMSEMMLKNDDHLSQPEEVVDVQVATVIENILENVVSPDGDIAQDQQHREQNEEKMLTDESFNQYEQVHNDMEEHHDLEKKMATKREEEQQQQVHNDLEEHHDLEKEMATKREEEQQQMSIESPIEQQNYQELEIDMVAVEEPIIEAKKAAPLFTNEETENENVTKPEEELLPCMVPETAPAEVLEPPCMVPEVAPAELLEPACMLPEVAPAEQLEPPCMVPETAPIEQLEPPCMLPETAASELLENSGMIPETAPAADLLEPTCMFPGTATAEQLESPMDIRNETEIVKNEEQGQKQEIGEATTEDSKEPITEEVKAVEENSVKPEVTTEDTKEPVVEEVQAKEEDTAKPEAVPTPEVTQDIPADAAVAVAATAAVAAAAVLGSKVDSSSVKKTATTKKTTVKTSTTAAKPKVGATTTLKKTTEVAKKPSAPAAKPRTTPTKPASATATDKKPIAKTTTPTTTSAGKPSRTSPKLTAKSTTTTSATRTVTSTSKPATTSRPITAPRPLPSTTAATRKPAGTSATTNGSLSKTRPATAAATTNGTLSKARPAAAPTTTNGSSSKPRTAATTAATNGSLSKPRPATAPAKPTTLGLSATNGAAKPKPKATPPRPTLTSQVRKTIPSSTGAKSPDKSTTTNGLTKRASPTTASRTKTTTSTVSSIAGTTTGKLFTARPAPKFTSSSSSTTTTTTTRRLTVGGTTTASTTKTITKTGSTPLRKSSPTKPVAGGTPTKPTTTAGTLKSKTPITKTSSPAGKPTPIRKPEPKTDFAANNDASVKKELNGTTENISTTADEQLQQEQTPQNGDLQTSQERQQNGDLQTLQEQQQNGDSSIPMQTEEQEQQSILGTGDAEIPIALTNA